MEPQGEFERFEQAVRLFDEATKRLPASPISGGGQVQQIKVDAGGWGVMISLVMVAFLAGVNIAQSAKQVVTATEIANQTQQINETRRKQDRDDDYINSIFRILPELKQKFDQDKEKRNVDTNHH